jgi:hypothetical protein
VDPQDGRVLEWFGIQGDLSKALSGLSAVNVQKSNDPPISQWAGALDDEVSMVRGEARTAPRPLSPIADQVDDDIAAKAVRANHSPDLEEKGRFALSRR